MTEDNPLMSEHAGEPLALIDTPDERAELSVARRGTRRWLEPLGMALMALGFVMIFQPFAKVLYTYSFIVILIGTLTFIVAVHLPE
jgi:hypothetical protein